MKIDLTSKEAAQLVLLGLESADSPLQITEGLAVSDLKIKQNGGVSFDLVSADDGDDDA